MEVIAIIILSILGILLVLYILVNILLLWQAKPLNSVIEDRNDHSIKTKCLKSHKYQIRSYIGCLPGLKGPRRTFIKKYEYSLRQCWFRMCCLCCQELHENQSFLDEVFIPPSVIIGQSKTEKPNTLPISPIAGAPQGNDTSPQRDNFPKISILAPDPIVVQMDRYTPATTTIQEDTEPVDFYAYQLEGKAGERMLY